MKVRRIAVSLAVTAALAVGSVPGTSAAECQFERPDGSCTNACIEVGTIVTRIVPVPWHCTM